ncbi:hypothetical protein SELMODRAFT_420769 [Selaginella moellendorffii]|uniref:Uncharacterized protein n=1 Tax=Selaginella moellendorffii TaxID=88036 RepID=D8SD21_SELML|nr:hypothetical protein SELMODRAFT_420769 [Selaginella moellendorffii]
MELLSANTTNVVKGKELDKKLLLSEWTNAVELDCRSELAERNPSRIGWHIEGLVISVIRVQGRLFDDAYSFKWYRTYAHGHEVAALRNIALQDLQEGVLMGPQAFNEKAVDLVYIKLFANGNYLVVALQITVAQWKAKEKKRSHTVWKDEVLPEWKKGLGAATVESLYYYAMPDTVKLKGLQMQVASSLG